jgi:Lrp/AsnC family leucine-responsive transcriptional regulator
LAMVDEMNRKILKLLMTDGKMTYNDVAQRLRRSPSTVRDRIRRLEDDKIILGYVAVINAEQLGMKAEGIMLANLVDGVTADKLRTLSNVTGVMEVLQVSGMRRVMIRLHAPNNHILEEIIQKEIVPLGLVDMELRIVLDSLMRFPGV